MGKTSFHFDDDFFEEILNGIPQKQSNDIENEKSGEVNSITTLSPDNKSRLKYVSKSILYTEESRELIINIIKKTKKDEKKKFATHINNKILKSIFKDKEEDDEEDEANEEVVEKGDGLFAKFKAIKKSYDTLQKVTRTVRNVYLIIEQIKFYYENLGEASAISALSSRDKVMREMSVYSDKLFDETINPIMENAILPAASSSLLEFCNRGGIFFKNIVRKYYEFLAEVMPPLVIKSWSKIIGFIPGGKAISAGIDKALGIYTYVKRSIGGSKLAMDILENPDKYIALAAGIWTTGEFLGALYTDDYDGLYKSMTYSFDKLNITGGKLISNLLSPSSRSSLSLSMDIMGKNSFNLYETGVDIFNNEIEDFEKKSKEKFESLHTRQEKFEYTYELITSIYTNGVEYSPWSRMARLMGGMLIRSQNLFDEANEQMYNTVSSFSNIIDQNKRPLNSKDIFNYLKGIVSKTYTIKDFNKGKAKTLKIYPKKNVQKILGNRPHYIAKVHTISQAMRIYKSPNQKEKGKNAIYEKTTKRYIPNIVINGPKDEKLKTLFRLYLPDENVNVSATFNLRYWKNQYGDNGKSRGKKFVDETMRPFTKSVNYNKFADFFNELSKDEKYKLFLDFINEEKYSHFSLIIKKLFGVNNYSGDFINTYFFKYYGKGYDDSKYVKYKTEFLKINENDKNYVGKAQMPIVDTYALNNILIKNGKDFNWMTFLNSDLFVEEFALRRFKGMCVNLHTALKYLNHEIDLKEKELIFTNQKQEE